MAEYPSIKAQIIDTDLFSGSADTLRSAYGEYYEIVDGERLDWVTSYDMYDNANSLFEVFMDTSAAETIDEDVLVANKKVPVRAYSNSEEISSDIFWKTLWIGGSFGDVTHSPIYNEIVHSYFDSEYELPYPQIEANAFSSGDIESTIEISYDYYAYLSQYQDYIAELDSELLIPNYYILFDMVSTDLDDPDNIDTSLYNSDLVSYVTADGNYEGVMELFDFDDSKVPPHAEVADYKTAYDGLNSGDSSIIENFVTRNSYLATDYLTGSYVRYPLSSSAQEWVEDHLQNLLFDEKAVELVADSDGDFIPYANMLPYKIKINFDEFDGSCGDFVYIEDRCTITEFADSIRLHDFSSKFIKTLYKAFDNKLDDLTPNEVEYVTSLQYSSASLEDEAEYTISTANNTTYREIDYVSFLAYCYNNYISSDEGCLFVGPSTIERLSAVDEKGTYRHINAQAALGVLTDTVEYLGDTTNIHIESHLYAGLSVSDKTYIEPLAYRIEKIGGPPTGDSYTQNTLQNFWFFKPEIEDNTFTFYDSQVKYDTDYTYKVYAYAVVVGYRYKFSDLALTRNIGCEGAEGEYGLEFYNPYSDDEETTSRLFTIEADGGFGSDYVGDKNILVNEGTGLTKPIETYFYFADYGDDAEAAYAAAHDYMMLSDDFTENSGMYEDSDDDGVAYAYRVVEYDEVAGSVFGTDAQIFSSYPYAADFYLNYEPTAKIIEIPLYEKTLKVLDNPTNKLNIVPYQVEGNSQKIGFDFIYTSFVENTFPSVISADDQEYKDDYQNANDLFGDSYLENQSIALQRYIEVYRLSSRPTAITDFDGAKIAEVDLAVEDLSQYSYKGSFYDDTIKTNQKYYYLFRVLNQQRVLSHLTEITEAELINDGGYKYAVFNILYEYELEQEVFNKASETFKKLIQLQPNLEQLQFNIDELDYGQEAASQINNLVIGASDDLIWDKTFKVRLTSKKTSRKIDLNITYRLNSD